MMLSEDKVRNQAKEILGFYDDNEAKSDTGQITTFKELLNIPMNAGGGLNLMAGICQRTLVKRRLF